MSNLSKDHINEGADIRKDSVRQARDTPCDALSTGQVKRYDCTNGGAQWCQGCYRMEEDKDGDYVRWEDYAALASQLALVTKLARLYYGEQHPTEHAILDRAEASSNV